MIFGKSAFQYPIIVVTSAVNPNNKLMRGAGENRGDEDYKVLSL